MKATHEDDASASTSDEGTDEDNVSPSTGSEGTHINRRRGCTVCCSPLPIISSHLFYVPTPVLDIIDVQPKELGIPTKAYYVVEEVKENETQKSQKVFRNCCS
ncbi:unnamed protein product [Cuscuta europaea]|uniref:Uncharacterized protein n=1 Tax=Cuscuta europaea TaxID=41803 RepID=A0A9P0Z435_CUSEU|nr:unnamed protein product [Cuscuta europaea]